MRLLTHNMLHSAHKRGVQKGYPLNLEIQKTEIVKQEINEMFLKNRLPKLDWNCFIIGCKSVGITDIPSKFESNLLNNNEFLTKCHHALLEIHVIDGNLICPESKRKFPIKDGIPNMLLREDELPNINDDQLLNVKDVKINKKKQQQNDNNEEKKDEITVIDCNNNNNNASNSTCINNNNNGKSLSGSANNDNGLNNGNKNDNPYLDPMLMKGLQEFSPQANENFVTSHKVEVDSQQNKNKSNNNNDMSTDNDNDILMTSQ